MATLMPVLMSAITHKPRLSNACPHIIVSDGLIEPLFFEVHDDIASPRSGTETEDKLARGYMRAR